MNVRSSRLGFLASIYNPEMTNCLVFIGMGQRWKPAILLSWSWLWIIAVIWELQQIYEQLRQVSVS